MITGSMLISALIQIIFVGLVCAILLWFIRKLGLPEPFDKAAQAIVALIAVVFLLNLLATFFGHPFFRWY